ncbi:MAG: hypothetical protein AAGA12_09750 [Pseudomonadota bacterium]
MELLVNPYSEEAIAALRSILSSYNNYEVGSWNRTSEKIKVAGEHKLRRFASGETWPERQTVEKIFKYFQVKTVRRSLWEEGWALNCRTDLEKLFGLPARRDPYRILKERAKLSDEEQQRHAVELKGDYFAIRPHPEMGSVLSHMRIFDSFPNYGLATCRISRAIRETPDGAIERDLVIDGGVFRKSSALNILGYDRVDGDVRMIALRDAGEGSYRGFVTGFDTRSIAFSARALVQKLPDPVEYEDIRHQTGWWDRLDELVDFLASNFGSDHLLLDRCRALEPADYMTSQPGS